MNTVLNINYNRIVIQVSAELAELCIKLMPSILMQTIIVQKFQIFFFFFLQLTFNYIPIFTLPNFDHLTSASYLHTYVALTSTLVEPNQITLDFLINQ